MPTYLDDEPCLSALGGDPRPLRTRLDLTARPVGGDALAAATSAADVVLFDTSLAQSIPAWLREGFDRWPRASLPATPGFDRAEAEAACKALARELPSAGLEVYLAWADAPVVVADGRFALVHVALVAVGPAGRRRLKAELRLEA